MGQQHRSSLWSMVNCPTGYAMDHRYEPWTVVKIMVNNQRLRPRIITNYAQLPSDLCHGPSIMDHGLLKKRFHSRPKSSIIESEKGM